MHCIVHVGNEHSLHPMLGFGVFCCCFCFFLFSPHEDCHVCDFYLCFLGEGSPSQTCVLCYTVYSFSCGKHGGVGGLLSVFSNICLLSVLYIVQSTLPLPSICFLITAKAWWRSTLFHHSGSQSLCKGQLWSRRLLGLGVDNVFCTYLSRLSKIKGR